MPSPETSDPKYPENTDPKIIGTPISAERLKVYAEASIDRLRNVFLNLPNLIDGEMRGGSKVEWTHCFITQLNLVLPDLEFLSEFYPPESAEDRAFCDKLKAELHELTAKNHSAMKGEVVLSDDEKGKMISSLSEIAGAVADIFNAVVS